MRGRSPNSGASVTHSQEESVGRRLRGLFKKSPSDTSLPKSLDTRSNNNQFELRPKRPTSAVGAPVLVPGTSSTTLATPPTRKTAASTTNAHTSVQNAVPQIWRLAFDDFKLANTELCERTSDLFSDQIGPVNDRLNVLSPSPATLAFERIESLQANRAALHHTSAKFRKVFEDTVALILKVKDAIAPAAAANPYACAALAAVGLLLPLTLVSSQENEMAIKGLNFVTILITEYRWKEKSYLSSDGALDFTDAVRKIYLAIYEYEAELYDHLQHNKLRRLGSNLYNSGRWSSKIDELKVLDASCMKLTDAIAETRAMEWKLEEQKWQDAMLSQPRLEAEKINRRHLYCAYEKAKNVNPVRATGTLEWFLKHPKFLGWRASQSCEFLWLVHDPGCGKSVLSKCLVDQKAEFSTVNFDPPLICYFFFREEDSTLTSAAAAIRSCLHQLLIQRPILYKYMARDFEEKGAAFLDDFDTLWSIFVTVCRDPSVTELVIILDALEQCQSSSHTPNDQRRKLASSLAHLYANLRELGNYESDFIRKFLVTSRPEIDIEREFRSITLRESDIRLSGNEEIDWLRQEVDIVVAQRLKLLAQKMQLTVRVREALSIRLSAMEHRSYLWVVLVFEFLESQVEISARNVPKLLAEMPRSVDDAYANLLSKVREPLRSKQLLQYVLAAASPLSLSDLNVLMNIDEECSSIAEVEVWPETAVQSNIRSLSGLLVTVIDSQVHLIHQTVRNFLTRNLVDAMALQFGMNSTNPWTVVLDYQTSHLASLQACINFLSMEFKDKRSTERANLRRGAHNHNRSADVTLFKHASTQWVRHFVMAGKMVPSDVSKHIAETLFDQSRQVFKLWLGDYVKSTPEVRYRPREGTGLMWAAFLGLDTVVEHLLSEVIDINSVDAFGRSALVFAAAYGHTEVVVRLLSRGALPDSVDWVQQTPLILATQQGHHNVTEILLNAGSDVKHIDVFGKTASYYGNDKAIQVKNLFKSTSDDTDIIGQTIAARIADVPTHADFESVLKEEEAYIVRQHEQKMWQPTSDDVLLRNMKTLKSTGLSTLYDNIVHAVEVLEEPDEANRYTEARDHILTAFTAIQAVIETESPLLLSYIPRILAYLWSHKHIRLACAVMDRLVEQSARVLDQRHSVRLMLSRISTSLSDYGSNLDVYSLVTMMFNTLITKWSMLLGYSHAQVIYATHVFHLCQSWFKDPATLIPSLKSLAETAIATHGPRSYAAVQIGVDIAELQLAISDYEEARSTAIDICEQIVLSFDDISMEESSRGSEMSHSTHMNAHLNVPGSQKGQPRALPENLLMIHIFLKALQTSAEAKFHLDLVDEAENEYREVVLTSSSLLGVVHSRTKRHRRSFAQFLKRIGKDEEANTVAYTY